MQIQIRYPKTTSLNYLVALTQESCDNYARHLRDDGLLLADSDAVKHIPPVQHVGLPLVATARDKVGKLLTLNIVTLAEAGRTLHRLGRQLLCNGARSKRFGRLRSEVGSQRRMRVGNDRLHKDSRSALATEIWGSFSATVVERPSVSISRRMSPCPFSARLSVRSSTLGEPTWQKLPCASREPRFGPSTTPAESGLQAGQAAEHVRTAMENLPERQRLALILTYYEGLANKEAAEILEVSVDALESLLARARRALRTSMDEVWQDVLGELERVSGADGQW